MQYIHILLVIIQYSLSLVQQSLDTQNEGICSTPDRSLFGFGCVSFHRTGRLLVLRPPSLSIIPPMIDNRKVFICQ